MCSCDASIGNKDRIVHDLQFNFIFLNVISIIVFVVYASYFYVALTKMSEKKIKERNTHFFGSWFQNHGFRTQLLDPYTWAKLLVEKLLFC